MSRDSGRRPVLSLKVVIPYSSPKRRASSRSSWAGLKPSMWLTRIESVHPPSRVVTGVFRALPMASQRAMSRAPLATWLWMVRRITAWICERSNTLRPTTWGAKTSSSTCLMDTWVSP